MERALADSVSHGEAQSVAALRFDLDEHNHRLAIEAGLGATPGYAEPGEAAAHRAFEISLTKLAGGIERLGADFHPLLGDVMWRAEMRTTAMRDSLRE